MWKQLSDITDADCGVYIDGAQCNAVEFDLAILRLACNYIEYDRDELQHLILDLDNEETGDQAAMQLGWDVETAIDKMNDQLDGYYFSIEESCLYISKKEEQ